MPSPDREELQSDLLAQSAWMKRLARSLVRGDDAADELVQDAWVAALRKPPMHKGALRAWTERVLRNLAAKRWQARERAPAAAHDVASVDPAADVLAERLETQRRLLDEIAALREPYRSTLLLHFFDGLPLEEIARRNTIPAGTVRWRMHEALELLRKRLDARHGGDRTRWQRALIFAVPPSVVLPPASHAPLSPTATVSPSLAAGALAVSTSTKILFALVAVVAVTGSAFYLVRDTASVQSAPVAPRDPPPDVSVAPSQEPLVGAAAAGDRAALRDPEIAKPAPALESEATPEMTAVTARCLEQDLRPAVRAWLGISRDASGAPGQERADATPTGDAKLDLGSVLREYSGVFAVGADGCATRFLETRVLPGRTTYLGDVVLEPGGAVSGSVRDLNGGPIVGAEVIVANPQQTLGIGKDLDTLRAQGPVTQRGRSPQAMTDATGAFRVEGAPAGGVRVWAHAEGMRWSFSEPLDVPARGELEDVVLVLEPETRGGGLTTFRGIVRAPDGTPIDRPRIQIKKVVGSSSTQTGTNGGADGRFEFPPLAAGPHRLTFGDNADRWTEVRLDAAEADGRELEIVLGEPKQIELLVRGPDGPVARFEVETQPAKGHEQISGQPRAFEDAEGRARVRVPAVDFRYVVTAPGFAREKLGPFDAQRPPPSLTVELDPLPGLRGRVTFEGRPIAGAVVRAHEDASGERVQMDDFLANVHPDPEAEATSDAEGGFQLDLRDSGRFVVFARADGFATTRSAPIKYSVREGSAGHEIALTRGGAVEGRVKVAAGRRAEGTIVGLNSGDARPITQVVGPDGHFRFERLTPGPWQLARARIERREGQGSSYSIDPSQDGTIPWNCTVVDGETTTADLDLTAMEPCAIAIDLRAAGEPAGAWQVMVFPQGSFSWSGDLPQKSLDNEGRGTLEVDDPGAYFVEARPPPESKSRFTARFMLDVKRGANPFTREIALGRIEGWIRVGAASDEVRFTLGAEGGDILSAVASVGTDGRFEIPLAPAGEGQLTRLTESNGRFSPLKLTSVTLVSGTTEKVDLR